jgi:WD40-like Beta Propeller Repeat
MKKSVLLTCCLLLLLLAGCAAEQIQAPAATSTLAPPSPTSSKTSFWRIVTSTITPDVTPTPTYEMHQQCMEISPEMPENAETSGVVVFRRKPDIFLLDMTTQQISQLSSLEETVSPWGVSPDRSLMAIKFFSDGENNSTVYKLVITDASGQRLKTIPWKNDWGYSLLGWVDNQHLFLNVNPDLEKDFSLWKFNPFTETQEGITLQNTAPGWNDFFKTAPISSTAFWPGRSTIWLDSRYTMAIYPRNIDEENERFTYNLWNIEEQRLVLSMDSMVNLLSGLPFYPEPAWSPDDSRVALGGIVWRGDTHNKNVTELFIITRSGQVKQMTHLARLDGNMAISSPSWSPDGRFIAFYLYPDANGNSDLAILDTYTEKLTDYCISVNSSMGIFPQPPAPLWSPDSKQLLLVDEYGYDQNSVIWVNPEQGLAAHILEDIVVEYWYSPSEMWGWMAAPEE